MCHDAAAVDMPAFARRHSSRTDCDFICCVRQKTVGRYRRPAGTAQTVFKFIPAEPLEVGSGYAFGIWGGLFLCMLGTELGSAVILLLSKKYGMRFVSHFTDPEKLKEFSFLQDNRKLRPLLFLIYFIPGAPKDLLTYFVAFTDIRLWEYLLITAVARIPSIITSTMCGAYFGEKNYLAAVLVYAATLALSGIGILVYRRIMHKGAENG